MAVKFCGNAIQRAQLPSHVSGDDDLSRMFDRNRSYFEDDLTTNKTEQTWIRLLNVQPGAFDDPIQAVLTTHLLNEDLSYEALSYCWGNVTPDNIYTISINGKAGFRITRNAFLALQYVRRRERPSIVWVDAICVQQANDPEKSQQVNIMSNIYSSATCVLCWLGECGSEDRSVCTDHQLVRNENGREEIECLTSPLLVVGENQEQEWWSRMWTIQECCLAKEVKFLIGPHIYDLMTLYRTLLSHDSDEQASEDLWPSSLSSVRVQLSYRRDLMGDLGLESDMRIGYKPGIRNMGLYHCLQSTMVFSATDPRDKIYGVVGFSRDTVKADYSKSELEVCIQAATTIFDAEGHLEALADCWARFEPAECSWVPKFSLMPTDVLPLYGAWNWEADYEPCPGAVDYSIQGTKLTVSSVRLDCVIAMVEGWKEGSLSLSRSNGSAIPVKSLNGNKIYGLEATLLSFLERASLSSAYPDFTFAFWSTIRHGLRMIVESPLEVDSPTICTPTPQELEDLESIMSETCMFVTSRGYLGIAHVKDVRPGDEIALIRWLSWPQIVRPTTIGFHLVTKAYVHGVMAGEMKDCWRDGSDHLERMTLT